LRGLWRESAPRGKVSPRGGNAQLPDPALTYAPVAPSLGGEVQVPHEQTQSAPVCRAPRRLGILFPGRGIPARGPGGAGGGGRVAGGGSLRRQRGLRSAAVPPGG